MAEPMIIPSGQVSIDSNGQPVTPHNTGIPAGTTVDRLAGAVPNVSVPNGGSIWDQLAENGALDAGYENSRAIKEGKQPTREIPNGVQPNRPVGDTTQEPELKIDPKDLDDPNKYPRNAREWKAYKEAFNAKHSPVLERAKKADEFEKSLADLNKQLEVSKGGIKAPADYEEVKAKYAELDKEMRLVAAERHPEIRKVFEQRQGRAMEVLKTIAPDKAEELSRLAELANNPRSRQLINEAIEKLPAFDQQEVASAIRELAAINRDKDQFRAQAAVELDRRAKAEQDAIGQRKEILTRQFNDTLKAAEGNEALGAFFKQREGDNEHNTRLESALSQARAAFHGDLPPADVAKFTQWAIVGQMTVPELLAAKQTIAKLEGQIEKLRGVQPTPSGSRTAPAAPESKEPPSNLSLGEKIAWSAQQAGIQLR